jgi:DNA-binding transcriptional ArsR family regulator
VIKLKEVDMLKLFDNRTRSKIVWNLIVYKELSAGQLAKMIKKNISTITRNLEVMREANLIHISRTKSKKNLRIKFWGINSDIFKEAALLNIEDINNLPPKKKKEVMNQLKNFILLSQSIIHNILSQNLEDPKNFNFFMLLLDKKTGKLFEQQIQEFIQNFSNQNKTKTINIDNLGLDTYVFFQIKSQIRNSVPPKEGF